jgi:hypothetical protein
MTRTTLKARVSPDGMLHVLLGKTEANREVQVTIEPVPAAPPSREDYLDFLRATAGAWQGNFERPGQGECEVRDPM